MFNNKALNAALRDLGGSFAAQNDALLTSNSALEDALRELTETARKNNEYDAAAEESLKSMLAKLETITGNFDKSARILQESCGKMAQLKPMVNKTELVSMNALASNINDLRATVIDAMQGGDSRAIDNLNTISAALEKNIGATFTTIDKTLTANAEKLFASYEKFFELCKTLSTGESGETREDEEVNLDTSESASLSASPAAAVTNTEKEKPAEPPPNTAALSYCKSCGAAAQAEFQFCAVCGAKIDGGDTACYTEGQFKIGGKGPGGIIFFLEDGQGLECSQEDLGEYDWSTAIRAAKKYGGGGYGDWYLPSKYELNLMYQNLKKKYLGGFGIGVYWSSSLYEQSYPWAHSFNDGFTYNYDSSKIFSVRAVRTFNYKTN